MATQRIISTKKYTDIINCYHIQDYIHNQDSQYLIATLERRSGDINYVTKSHFIKCQTNGCERPGITSSDSCNSCTNYSKSYTSYCCELLSKKICYKCACEEAYQRTLGKQYLSECEHTDIINEYGGAVLLYIARWNYLAIYHN